MTTVDNAHISNMVSLDLVEDFSRDVHPGGNSNFEVIDSIPNLSLIPNQLLDLKFN